MDPATFNKATAFSARKTIYAHNIRISCMPQVESQFNQYLRMLCAQANDAHASPSQPTSAVIIERKLTVAPHNTWLQIGLPSLISLSKDSQGIVQTTGSLRIIDYVLHAKVALIFKLEYRGRSLILLTSCSIKCSWIHWDVQSQKTTRFRAWLLRLFALAFPK